MFGINALSQPELIQNPLVPPCLADSHVTVPEQPNQLKAPDESLYLSCFVHPLTIITKTLEKLPPKEEVKEKGNESDSLGYMVLLLNCFPEVIQSAQYHSSIFVIVIISIVIILLWLCSYSWSCLRQ